MELYPWKENKDDINGLDIFLEILRHSLLVCLVIVGPTLFIIVIFFLMSCMP